ncbi:MAG: hypothetical protein GY820_38030, partial [Gammaproteobacteria bacterium]|nr:hypothetical protein [Gammaproteobacteria bacterium]
GQPFTVLKVDYYNDKQFDLLTTEMMTIEAQDSFKMSGGQLSGRERVQANFLLDRLDEKGGRKSTGGAAKLIRLRVGQQVDLVKNVDVTDGLTNGQWCSQLGWQDPHWVFSMSKPNEE